MPFFSSDTEKGIFDCTLAQIEMLRKQKNRIESHKSKKLFNIISVANSEFNPKDPKFRDKFFDSL